jgi:hypothetical protein
MIEADWLTCTEPTKMLMFLRGKASQRRWQLFVCACVRSEWVALTDARSRNAVVIAERFVEGTATLHELDQAGAAAAAVLTPQLSHELWSPALHAATVAIEVATTPPPWELDWDARKTNQLHWLREIFGNPFRPVTLNPSLVTETVIRLARTMYEHRSLDQMPILADALEESGVRDSELLAHCRDPGPHVRGCWVVDLILGKS